MNSKKIKKNKTKNYKFIKEFLYFFFFFKTKVKGRNLKKKILNVSIEYYIMKVF